MGQDLRVKALLDLQGHLVGHQVKVLLDHQVQLDHRDWVVLMEDLQGRQGHLDWYVLMVDRPLVHLVWDLLVRAIQQVQVPLVMEVLLVKEVLFLEAYLVVESMDHQVLDLAFWGSLHQVLLGLEDQQVKAYPLHQ